jgi:rubrerythrin
MDIPDLNESTEKAKEHVTEAVKRVKSELSILPDRFVCPQCDVPCEPDWKYDRQQAAFYSETNGKVPSWRCPECGTHYRRKERSIGIDPYDR